MNTICIIIDTNNDAFRPDPAPEVARILRRIAEELESGREPSVPRDINGNRCGNIIIEGDW